MIWLGQTNLDSILIDNLDSKFLHRIIFFLKTPLWFHLNSRHPLMSFPTQLNWHIPSQNFRSTLAIFCKYKIAKKFFCHFSQKQSTMPSRRLWWLKLRPLSVRNGFIWFVVRPSRGKAADRWNPWKKCVESLPIGLSFSNLAISNKSVAVPSKDEKLFYWSIFLSMLDSMEHFQMRIPVGFLHKWASLNKKFLWASWKNIFSTFLALSSRLSRTVYMTSWKPRNVRQKVWTIAKIRPLNSPLLYPDIWLWRRHIKNAA